jgi:hypothetical protein
MLKRCSLAWSDKSKLTTSFSKTLTIQMEEPRWTLAPMGGNTEILTLLMKTSNPMQQLKKKRRSTIKKKGLSIISKTRKRKKKKKNWSSNHPRATSEDVTSTT